MNSPQAFDEEKYKKLLGGLECSEVMLSNLNEDFRIDSEYFLKLTLKLQGILKKNKCVKIGDIATVTDGIHSSIEYDSESGINLISATSPRKNTFDLSRGAFISKSFHEENPRTALKEGDVILSTVGTIGNCAVVDNEILPANSDRHVGIIRVNGLVNPYVLSTFLLTKYGVNQTKRETTGNVQPNLFLYKIKSITIPLFSAKFQAVLVELIMYAKKLGKQADIAYTSAETLLLTSLNLQNFTPSRQNTSVKRFSETFASGRLDAEYYQAKYDEIEERIKSYKYGYSIVGKCFQPIKDDFDRKENSYPYIEIGDVNIGNATAEHNIISTEDLPDNAKIKVEAGDILVSKVRPNRGAVTIVKDIPNLIVSGAFCVLRSTKAYSPETLLVLLRTAIYKEWLLKWNVGTSYPVIKDKDVYNLPIPLLPEPIQQQISAKVKESFALREQSKQLLKAATRAVEIAIEEGEATALKYLEAQAKENV